MDGEHQAIGYIRGKEFGFLVHLKLGVKSLPEKIVAELDPSIRVNLANSILRKIPKFKKVGLLTFDAMGIHNIDFPPSTRAKRLNGTRRDNFRDDSLGYMHDF